MHKQIKNICKKLYDEFSVIIHLGSELEFYLSGNDERHNICLAMILKKLAERKIVVVKLEKESGKNQYEIALGISRDALQAIDCINELKAIIENTAAEFNIKALFDAKPFEDQPGSGLHINISLHDDAGKNMFAKVREAEETELMKHSIGGLLETLIDNMRYFAPNEESYLRFTAKKNNACEDTPTRAYNNAPVNVSWGSNNRTTAIRIPSSTLVSESRHIEHRVSGADADAAIVVLKILEGIYHGLKNSSLPPEKIFGNAYDEQYSFLAPLPRSLAEAVKDNEGSGI